MSLDNQSLAAGEVQPALSKGSMFKRSLALLTVGAIVVVALVWWGGGLVVLAQIQAAHWQWILVAFASHYLGFGIRGLRWRWILHAGGAQLSAGYAFSLVVSGWFFNSVAPARAGDLLRIAMLRYGEGQTQQVNVGSGVGAVVAERALDLLAILTLSGLFSLLITDVALPGWLGLAYGGLALMLVLVVLGTLAAPWLLNNTLARWNRLTGSKFMTLIEETIVALRAVGAHPARFVAMLVLSLLIWLCDAAILWASIHALSGTSTFWEAEFVGLTGALAAAAPLTPGAMGQIEAAYAGLLLLVGERPELIPTIILVSRGISYWLFLPVAGAITVAAGLHRFWPVVARSRSAVSTLVGKEKKPDSSIENPHQSDLQ